jgi:hypothetical protein
MVSASVLVSVEAGKNQEVVAALRSMDAVKQAHACWGQPDIFAFVEVADEPTWRTAWAVLHAQWSAKPEQLDHLNDPLVLGDAVIEQHRSLAEDLDRALVELLTKRVLGGDRLAERLQRGGEVAPGRRQAARQPRRGSPRC